MADFSIPFGKFFKVTVAGNGPVGGSGTPTSLLPGGNTIGLSASDYLSVYVADLGDDPTGPGRVFAVVPKQAADMGGSYTVGLNFTGKDGSSGNVLNPMSLTAEIVGPAPGAPGASNMGLFNSSIVDLASAPPDPGTATITF